MMDYDEFKESVTGLIRDVLPEKYEDAEVEVRPTEKINKSYEALFVKPVGQNTSVAIDLEQFYEEYVDGRSFQDTLSAISEMIQKEPQLAVDMDMVQDYEAAKGRLFIRVCGVEQNQELLENIPHRTVEDMAVTYHLLIGGTSDGLVASAIVTDAQLKAYGVTEEQLHQDAVENSPKLFPAMFVPMKDVMQEIYHEELINSGMPEEMAQIMMESMIPQEDVPMYILTNDQKINGAGVLFYPEVMDKIGDTLGSDFIILPSSTHEVLIIPDDGRMTALESQEMVAEVNRNEVSPEERLTDESYHYDRKAHVFEKFSSYEARMQEKESEIVQTDSKSEEKNAPEEHVRPRQSERKSALGRSSGEPAPKRESVLKKLEVKKTEVKAREAGKTTDRTRSAHSHSDNVLA